MQIGIEFFGLIATVLAVVGVLLNNRLQISCFYLWIVSNTISLLIHISIGIWSLALRDLIFLILAVEGILIWGNKSRKYYNDEEN